MATSPIDLHADKNLVQDLSALDALWNPAPTPYQHDPVLWMEQVARQETWSKQREIFNSVAQNRYTAVKSCHGPGKSFTGAWTVAWWLATKLDPFVVTSAPTSHQVRTILWREIRRAKQAINMPGKITQGQVPEWRIADELVAFGRKPADYLDAQVAQAAFQGIHALHVLVVLDEGSGIPQWLADACENLITNEHSRLLIIGNPDNPVSYFQRAFKPASGFEKITISAFETPNFTQEPVSENLKERLTSKIWVEERRQKWGEESPLWKSKVLGEFPEVTDDTVFTPAIMQKALLNDRSSSAVNQKGRYGFDVARLGPDECVVYHNRNGYIRMIGRWGKIDTMETVGRFRRLTDNNPQLVPPTTIDANGLGAGPYDRLKELGYEMLPFNGSERAYNATKYANRRSEAYWSARELMDEAQVDIEPEDEDLQAELYEVHFKLDSNGRIQIEPKEDIAKRLSHSPDRADAFVMSMQQNASIKQFIEANKTPQERAQETGVRTNQASDNPSQSPASDDIYARPGEPNDLVADLNNVQF